jgi:hypothetical protein
LLSRGRKKAAFDKKGCSRSLQLVSLARLLLRPYEVSGDLKKKAPTSVLIAFLLKLCNTSLGQLDTNS